MKTKYMLRKAAGSYWLLDMAQNGKDYKRPLELNESGAMIWNLLNEGRDMDEAALYMSKEYGIGFDEAREDTAQFIAELKAAGISAPYSLDGFGCGERCF